MAPLSRSGWKPSPFDSRDFLFDAETLDVGPNPANRRVEIDHPIDPRDQGEVPCCVPTFTNPKEKFIHAAT